MRPPPDSPYGAYLRRIEADGTLRANTLTVDAPRDGGMSGAGRTSNGWRRGAGNALATVLPEPEAGLAAGILIGLRDLVDRDLAAAFTTAGVSHVVAISGWNIAIVAAAIGACAGPAGSPSPVRRHGPGDRRVRRVRRRVGVRGPGRAHGRCRAAGPREWPRGTGGHRARLDGRRAAVRRPRPRPRRRSPVVGARDRRPHRLGDADRRRPGPPDPRPIAGVADREPRASPSRRRPRRSRSSSRRSGGCHSSRRREPRGGPARRAGDGRRPRGAASPGRLVMAGAPWPSGRSWPRRPGSSCGSRSRSSTPARACRSRASPSRRPSTSCRRSCRRA